MTLKTKLPPIETFRDVTVVPFLSTTTGLQQESGPIWPDWDSQIAVRHCRNGIPFDKLPKSPDKIDLHTDEPLIWAGRINSHFGHYIAEDASRILPALNNSKNKKLLFGCHNRPLARSGTLDRAPTVFLQIAKWFGLPQDRIQLCTQNMKVAVLDVAPQAEQLINLRTHNSQVTISDEYLDLLDENTWRNNLSPLKNKVVFVSRGKISAHLDAHAASRYLDFILESLGVYVFHPEEHSLEDQLSVYAGADQLIFAEGSSAHGLQLLGRGLKSVAILNRRPGAKMASFYLNSRCSEVQYINAIDSVLFWKKPTIEGVKIVRRFISRRTFFNTKQLFESFGSFGINLSSVWDHNLYRRALEEDLKSWTISTGELFMRRWKTYGDQSELIFSLNEKGFENEAKFVKSFIANSAIEAK